MEINFGIKKVWKDLIESKECWKYLYWLSGIIILADIFTAITKVSIFYSLAGSILGSYYILMTNNIIHDKKPILENLGAQTNEDRNLFLVFLQVLGIGIVYGVALVILGLILFALFAGALKLDAVTSAILMIIMLLPLLILISFCNLLFAENLSFGDAFNLKKAYASFKYGWTKYLTVFSLYILICIALIVLLFLIAFPILLLIIGLLHYYPAITVSKEGYELIGRILGIFITIPFAIILPYWYHNATAQIYKYTILKMNEHN